MLRQLVGQRDPVALIPANPEPGQLQLRIYDRLGPRTRGHIEALLVATHRTGSARMLAPADLVAVGWLPPAWEPAGTRVLHRDGADAEVEVYSATGDRQTVHTVREGKSWKVELPLR